MSDFTTCDNNQLTDEQLFAALATKDSNGNWALRTTFVDACATDAIDCTNASLTKAQITRKVIGVDPVCGKPAIRLASAMGYALQSVGTYANDAAAAAASPAVPVGGIYYKTGVGLHTRMS